MKNSFLVDYAACILLRTLGPAIRALPRGTAFWLGARLGEMVFLFDGKHRTVVYRNLKTAFGRCMSVERVRELTLMFYRSFGRNLMEVFLIPVIDGDYARKYVSIEGIENAKAVFSRGKGVIFVSVHEGSWELSNIIASYLNLPFAMFVREQKLPRLNALLNDYRGRKGCRIIRKEDQTRELIRILRANESFGMTVDQGGRSGVSVPFFGKEASMSSGAVKLALKYGAALVPVFSVRLKGPYIKLVIAPAAELSVSGDMDRDIKDNLSALIRKYEEFLARYPQEYLWYYKIWKYSPSRDILILSDGKTGHLRQSEALARIAADYLSRNKGVEAKIHIVKVEFKNGRGGYMTALAGLLPGKWAGTRALRKHLSESSYTAITALTPDLIISCGSSTAAVNLIASKDSGARSVVIMKPGLLGTRSFDLCVIPEHDNPPGRPNVVVTKGALNLINKEYLAACGKDLAELAPEILAARPIIGVLLGGDAKGFVLDAGLAERVLDEIKSAAERLNAGILVTTSRRTSRTVENAVKDNLKGESRCKALIIANERNYDFALGGILDKSDVVVISPESMSMVSEAVSSGKGVVVFDAAGLSAKHRRLITVFEEDGKLKLASAAGLSGAISEMFKAGPSRGGTADDNALVREGLKRIL